MTGETPAEMPGEERAFNLAARAMQRRFGASGTEEDIEAALSEFFAPILAEKERATVKRIAEVASVVAAQAGVGASETAGLIVSVLAANPEHTERFMSEGSELFIDGTIRPENGCLTHMAMNGQVVSPTKLRMMKGQSQ